MCESHFIIIGAGHAGVGLAIGLRKHGWPGKITLLSREMFAPYQKPPLSKQISASTPGSMIRPLADLKQLKDLEIELSLDCAVCQIDPEARTLSLLNGAVLAYEKLAVCTGSRPVDLQGLCGNPEHIMSLDSLESAMKVQSRCNDSSHATIIGGGPTSLETAASLAKHGLQITIINRGSRLMQRHCSESYSDIVESEHRGHRVEVLNNCEVTGLEKLGSTYKIKTSTGKTLHSDFVISGIGSAPNTKLLDFMGEEVHAGIDVDIFCRSQVDDIYALGDCARYPFWNGDRLRIESLQAVKIQVSYLLSHLCGTPAPTYEPFIFNTSQFGIRYYRLGDIKNYNRKESEWDELGRKGLTQYFLGNRLVGAEVVNDLVKVRRSRDLLTITN